MRILVVDDNRDAADTLSLLLELLGEEVLVAYDGATALELVEKSAPFAVFLDLGMPHMDGFEVARRIRNNDPHHSIKLVAVSGWGQQEDLKRTRAAGFDHHLVKPVDGNVVKSFLSKLESEARAP